MCRPLSELAMTPMRLIFSGFARLFPSVPDHRACLAHRRSALHPRYRRRVARLALHRHRSCPPARLQISASHLHAAVGIATSDMGGVFPRQLVIEAWQFFADPASSLREGGGSCSTDPLRAADHRSARGQPAL